MGEIFVDLDLIKRAVGLVLDSAAVRVGKVLHLEDELYWYVPSEELCNPDELPKQLTLGAAEDDWASLQRLVAATANGRELLTVSANHYFQAAALLRLLGEQRLRLVESSCTE